MHPHLTIHHSLLCKAVTTLAVCVTEIVPVRVCVALVHWQSLP